MDAFDGVSHLCFWRETSSRLAVMSDQAAATRRRAVYGQRARPGSGEGFVSVCAKSRCRCKSPIILSRQNRSLGNESRVR